MIVGGYEGPAPTTLHVFKVTIDSVQQEKRVAAITPQKAQEILESTYPGIVIDVCRGSSRGE